MGLTIVYEAGDINGRQGNRVVLSYRGRELARPNPINLESVRALERQGRLTIILESNIAGLEAVGGKVRVNFHESAVRPLDVDRVIYALGGTTTPRSSHLR